MGDEKEIEMEEKTNAWTWFISNFAFILVLAVGFVVLGVFFIKDLAAGIVFVLLGTANFAIVGAYTPQWYKKLVKENYIKTFADSNFWEIFKS